ncbi:MAG: DMT family transporter [Alistipes sp.]
MHTFKGGIYAILSSGTFGLIPLFSLPLLQSGLHPTSILFYRLGFAALMMGLIVLLTRRSFRVNLRDLVVLAGLGALYLSTSLGLLLSYNYIPSGVTTTINFLYPLVVAIAMSLFFKEKSSIWILVAVLISLAGVGLLSWGDIGNNDPGKGVLFAAMTIFSYAIYIIMMMKSRVATMDSLVLTFYVLLFGALCFLLASLVFVGSIDGLHGGEVWMNILLLAAIPTVFSNITLVLAIKAIGSTMTSILGSMEPLMAVLVGVLHFGETFNMESAAGLILVITSVIIVILQSKHKEELPTA